MIGNVSTGDYAPTKQAIAVRAEIVALIDAKLEELKTVMATDVADFNKAVAAAKVPAIFVPEDEK